MVASVDVFEPLRAIPGRGARWAYLLVKAADRPVGWITCPIVEGVCEPERIRHAIATTLSGALLSALLFHRLGKPVRPGGIELSELFERPDAHGMGGTARISVAICTRDRPRELRACLSSLARLPSPPGEVIVVDNASRLDHTRKLVVEEFPGVVYVREDRAGLDWARNRALETATGDIIAYVDDDTRIDPGWLAAIARAFEDRETSAVCGLIAPYELETDAQLAFEILGGFGRGCRKAWYRVDTRRRRPDIYHLGAGVFGAGANMAFRRSALIEAGGFDCALDVGTPTEGGGDLEMFLRLLHEGHELLYEPAAIIWHRHRDTPERLEAQIATWGTAIGAILCAAFLRYPGFRWRITRFAMRWSWSGYIGPLAGSAAGPGRLPRGLRLAPLRRLPLGPLRYLRARRAARERGAAYRCRPQSSLVSAGEQVAIRSIDLAEPLGPLESVAGRGDTRVHVFCGGKYLGEIAIANRGHPVRAEELRARVAQDLAHELLALAARPDALAAHLDFPALLHAHLPLAGRSGHAEFAPDLASVVVATRRRPAQLRRCLESLFRQSTTFPFEIVVVNNDPDDHETEAVIRSFGSARYVAEPVQGLAPARNTGLRAARGEIMVTTDDDVVAPPHWLQEIVQPFRFAHVGIVTGRVVPLSLETRAQRDFETIGALDKGATSFEVANDWLGERKFLPPRAWDLGATANAAFRRDLFKDARVGLLPEALGPGTPAGGGEDAYFFYSAIKAGYAVYYEPAAALLHEHRRSDRELARQMRDYGRGHVAYLLTTLFDDKDFRALARLATVLPAWHLWRLVSARRRGERARIVAAELGGCLTGLFGWIRGRRQERARRQSRPRLLAENSGLRGAEG